MTANGTGVQPDQTGHSKKLGSQESLTRHEWVGLMNKHNLADGHSRLAQSDRMLEIVAGLPELYTVADHRGQVELEREFEEAYFTLAGQPSVLRREQHALHFYSSSLAMEAVANHLRLREMSIGVLHPTFDNIPAILRRHGLEPKQVPEQIFDEPENPAFYQDLDSLLLVVPNNPTGTDAPIDVLKRIALSCKAAGVLLILDFSFRFFSRHLSTVDFYGFLAEEGVAHIGIEDTGKTWPTLDLKVGTLIADPSCHAGLQAITDDMLLNVSPFVFALVAEYIRRDGARESLRVEGRNRAVLRESLAGGPLQLIDPPGPMSVAWLRMPEGWVDTEAADWLAEQGVSVLPGGPFFWDDREEGQSYLRVAMMRPEDEFATGAAALAEAAARYRPGGGPGRPELAELVLTAVAQLLTCPQPTAEDDFFVLGGDSLSAMHLVGRLAQDTGLPLRVKMLLDAPVLGDFVDRVAGVLEQQGAAEAAPDPAHRLRSLFADQRAGAEA